MSQPLAHATVSVGAQPHAAAAADAHADRAIVFECEGEPLVGVLSMPADDRASRTTGVLVIVGGPQYRVGSHRQFVLLARRLAAAGYPTLRFDYRGMGDAGGAMRGFESVEADVRAGLDRLLAECPRLERVVLWGLCDAASVAMMYAHTDPRVAGIVALNPWARSEASLAAAHMKHYYLRRLLEREFWSKLLSGRLALGASLGEFARSARAARRAGGEAAVPRAFQSRMAEGLKRFGGPMLLVLSGRDLTAREFIEYSSAAADWRGVLDSSRIGRCAMAEADHTFSRAEWRAEVEAATVRWLAQLPPADPDSPGKARDVR